MHYFRHVLMVSIAALFIATNQSPLAADEDASAPANGATTAAIAPKIGPWGFDLSGLEPSVHPGDDFYQYANGAWAQKAIIAPDSRTSSAVEAARQNTSAAALELVKQIVTQDWPPDSDEAKFVRLYKSYLDRDAVNRLGSRPIKPFQRYIEAVRNREDLTKAIAELRLNIGGLFVVRVKVDPAGGQRYIPAIEQSNLLLGDRQIYVHDSAVFVERRKRAVEYLAPLLGKIGGPIGTRKRVEAVLALETRLAKLYPERAALRDPDVDNAFLSLAELQDIEPRFDWATYFEVAGIGKPDRVHVRLAGNLSALITEFETTSLGIWRDYLRLRALTAYGAYLSDSIASKVRAFEAVRDGVELNSDSVEQRAAEFAMRLMPDVVGRAFLQARGPDTHSETVLVMAEAIRDAYRRRIEASKWLSAETKIRAIEKLEAVSFIIGGPPGWNDYRRWSASEKNLFNNVYWSRQVKAEAALRRLQRLQDAPNANIDDLRSHLFFSPLQIGAYYLQTLNTVIIPASYLQSPFYDPGADMAINFGALGTTIGHELGHAFDDQGSKYGPDGQLIDWWSQADRAEFEQLGKRLAAEFSTYNAYEDIKIDPRLSLGESLSDLAGLEVAYEAYSSFAGLGSLSSHARKESQKRFLLGYAQKRRSVRRPGVSLELALSGVHAPPVHRVNGIVPHLSIWYEAFDITPDHALWRSPEDRLTIW